MGQASLSSNIMLIYLMCVQLSLEEAKEVLSFANVELEVKVFQFSCLLFDFFLT